MTLYTATGLSVLTSAAFTVGMYLMKREAERLPSLGGGWRLAAWWAFMRDAWWLLGLGLQIVGFALYLFILHDAPLSIVHTALNGGIALFVVLAVVGLGERVRTVEWLGVSLIVVALIALSWSLSEAPEGQSSGHGVVAFSCVLLGLAATALAADRAPRRAVGLSVASGLALGLGSVYAKAMAIAPSVGAAAHSPYLMLTIGANLIGFVLMQASFQAGRGVVVMPLFSGISNLVPIVGGLVVFDEPLPAEGIATLLRPLAFGLAIVGGALLAGFGARRAASMPDGEA